jgi:hypothetical protein
VIVGDLELGHDVVVGHFGNSGVPHNHHMESDNSRMPDSGRSIDEIYKAKKPKLQKPEEKIVTSDFL